LASFGWIIGAGFSKGKRENQGLLVPLAAGKRTKGQIRWSNDKAQKAPRKFA
jgi:hypothetical protein